MNIRLLSATSTIRTATKTIALSGLLFLISISNLLAQGTAPALSITAEPCSDRFYVDFPVWWANCGGNDEEIDDLKVYYNTGSGDVEIWHGWWSNSSGYDGEAAGVTSCWDDDEYVATSESWQSTTSQSYYGDGASEPWVYIKIYFYNVPSSWYNGQNITIKVSGNFDDGDQGYNQSRTMSFQAIPAPINVQATAASFCDKINVSWTKPTLPCSDASHYYQVRWKTPGGSYGSWNNVSGNGATTTYSHTGLSTGTTYDYQVRTVLNVGNAPVSTEAGTPTSGSTIPLPPVPTALQASDTRCDQKVALAWQWNGVSPSAFRVKRETTEIGTVSGNDRSYIDDVPARGTTYNYYVQAQNTCGWGSYTAAETGVSPADPGAPSNILATPSGTGINVTWNDNSTTETGFIIERTLFGGGGSNFFNVAAGVTSYLDNSVVGCQTYAYVVKSKNDCQPNGVAGNSDTSRIVPNLATTFTANALKGSKGYFTDKVELTWTNGNVNLINSFKIYRRILGSGGSFALLTNLNNGSGIFNDLTADAGVMYEYKIQAEGLCENTTIYSNEVTDIGFRSPSGIVNGHVNYAGGIAVANARIIVTNSNGATGSSLLFNGTNQFVTVPHKTSLMAASGLTVQAWVRPTALSGNAGIVEKSSGANGYGLKYISGTNKVRFFVYEGGTEKFAEFAGALTVGQYTHLAGTYDGVFVRLFVDGEIKDSAAVSSTITANTADLLIGKNAANEHFAGNIDEIRVFTTGLSNEVIARDYTRILNGNEAAFAAYLRADENVGGYIFDASKNGNVYNENHGIITGATWSVQIPTNEQLGLIGITNSLGNYTVTNIRYTGVGENFTLTPIFETHTFDPGTRILFIGEGASVHNNQDFLDNSSFLVTGTVQYDGTSCFAKDVFIKIDGEVVVQNGAAVQTDASGAFSIQVPIGNHFLTTEMAGHYFSVGHWPVGGGTFNFQEPISGIEFKDSTLIKVVGRVVGGTREGNKAPGLGRSVNNIGVAEIEFVSQQGGGCLTTTATTDPLTGEYSIELPPLRYVINDVSVATNPVIDFGTLDLLDLTPNLPLQTVIDTTYLTGTTTISTIDSVKFHKRNDYIYRVAPEMFVFNEERTGSFIGDTVAYLINDVTSDTTTVNLTTNPFTYPVLSQAREYSLRVFAFERYDNFDSNPPVAIDSVPISDGVLHINNNLAVETALDLNIDTGEVIYTFLAGEPNSLINNSIPEYSFTKSFEILLEVGPHAIQWEPITGPIPFGGNRYFRGYMLGGKALGNSFITQGPQVVSKILRDPPGSASSSTLEEGTTFTDTYEWSVDGGVSGVFNKRVVLGTEFTTGIGYAVTTEIHNDLLFGTTLSTVVGGGEVITETTSTTETFATNGNAELVGSLSDLYMGRSQNMIFGIADNIKFLRDSICNLPNMECLPQNFGGYRLGKQKGFFIVPGGFGTEFIYDQNHILNYLIPNIQNLRNSFFVNYPAKYISHLSGDDDNFGVNNDSPVWGNGASSADSIATEDADTTGLSYTFHPESDFDIDSVRLMNQQIRLWRAAIELNEKDKVTSDFERNISFNAGPTIGYSQSTTRVNSNSTKFEVNLEEDIALAISAEVAGNGVEIEQHLILSLNQSHNWSTETERTTTYAYEFHDEEEGDFFSVDIKKSKLGFGPIFKTVAGQTSCPYEGEDVTLFYQPGAQLSAATLQREVPVISVSPAIMINVPEDEPAVFNLSLGNASASSDDMTYRLSVIQSSNPFGAIIKVDDLDPNRTFDVNAGTSINKVLTVEKGPSVHEYDSLMLVFHSDCEPGVLADTIYVSVHFLPGCSDIELLQPDDQWVLNNSFNDTLPIVLGGYNINYSGIESIKFQYKPTSDPDWINLQTFYKDTNGLGLPDAQLIPTTTPYTTYFWNMDQVVDGDYNIRAVSSCSLADNNSQIFTGHADRVNPHPFGSPQPADGILSPNDEIMIQFNEVIDAGSLTWDNFDIRGVLNGAALRHSTSVHFDGVNDDMKIGSGISLVNRSFTTEFWAKREATGEECLVSQGINPAQSLFIGFNSSNQFTFTLAGQTVNTPAATTDNDWHHYAVSYNHTDGVVQIFKDAALALNSVFFAAYNEGGAIYLGKSSAGLPRYFNGNIHEFRIWNKVRGVVDIAPLVDVELSGREAGLIGNWRMDEGIGSLARDYARSRNGVVNADWTVLPSGRSIAFDGVDDHLEAMAGNVAFNNEMDFTIEFWFKGGNGTNVTLFSNGRGDGTDGNYNAWSIGGNANGKLEVKNNGATFLATDTNFFDNNWHHFALVVRRVSNTACYVDGNLQNTTSNANWKGFGGAKVFLGCRGWYTGVIENRDQYFAGNLEEVRIWKLARKQEQIVRDRVNRLIGDEFGLVAYYPFEFYQDNGGILLLTQTLTDESMNSNDLTSVGGASHSTIAPNIKLERPIENVNFTYSVNQDKIIFTPSDPPARIENVTLDITVRDIRDLHGNTMQSPVSWIAYVDKNQVVWDEQQLDFSKLVDAPLSFTTPIRNLGGQVKQFSIDNLPAWLTANPQSGTIEPNSYLDIDFVVNPGLNIGQYSNDIYVHTDFDFDEKLLLNLNVYAEPPAWTVVPGNYEYSMNVIGQISVDGNISTDPNDMLAAFVNGTCRGVANLQYVEQYDMYEAFIDVYSDSLSGETMEFRIWNASEGRIHTQVTPTLPFADNQNYGTPAVPIIFNAIDIIEVQIPVVTGWNWLSFNMSSPDMSIVDNILGDLNTVNGDLIKGQSSFDQYSSGTGWVGGITSSGGLRSEETYKLRVSNDDIIYYEGTVLDPDFVPVTVASGWNWIGYISQRNIAVNDALAFFNAAQGDLVKSQHSFAVYDGALGWIGSLQYMQPNDGYMLKTTNGQSFTYPRSGILGDKTDETINEIVSNDKWTLTPHKYENNMNMMVCMGNCEAVQIGEETMIGAFVGNECRGISKAVYNSAIEKHVFFLTVYGNQENETVNFKFLNDENGAEKMLKQSIGFAKNNVVGEYNTPYKVDLLNTSDCEELILSRGDAQVNIYPVPFSELVNVDVWLSEDQNLSVTIYDIVGQKVTTLANRPGRQGLNKFLWSGNNDAGKVADGIYFVEVVTGNTRKTQKIIKY